MTKEISGNFQIIWTDIKNWAFNALIFSAPMWIIFLGFVVKNMEDGFQTADLVPNSFVLGSMLTWLFNEIIALFKKFAQRREYVVVK